MERERRMSHAAGHRFHPTLLREYDIRGIVGETLYAADARAHRPGLRHHAARPRAAGGSASATTAA